VRLGVGAQLRECRRRQRFRVDAVQDRVVEHCAGVRVGLEGGNDAIGLHAIREDREPAVEAGGAQVLHGPDHVGDIQRRLATVELNRAVGRHELTHRVERTDGKRLRPTLGPAIDDAERASAIAP